MLRKQSRYEVSWCERTIKGTVFKMQIFSRKSEAKKFFIAHFKDKFTFDWSVKKL